ncbi:MAG: AIR carboxylase family protein [Bdellovibrio sp.]|nr:AIR carboxylase family protein [Bdellovibrio sp.]
MKQPRVLVLFGSKSDAGVYQPLMESLSPEFKTDLAIISAHRNYRELEQRLNQRDFDMVLAGAGLSAHLPGVVAAQFDGPVIGIPVASRLGGFDAFLSISQMPKGVPVLATFPEANWQAVSFLKNCIKKSFDCKVNLVCKDLYWQYEYSRNFFVEAQSCAQELKITWNTADAPRTDCLNLFVITDQLDFKPLMPSFTAIYIPMMEPIKAKSHTRALDIFEWARINGPWVGLNNFVNAVRMADKIFKLQEVVL